MYLISTSRLTTLTLRCLFRRLSGIAAIVTCLPLLLLTSSVLLSGCGRGSNASIKASPIVATAVSGTTSITTLAIGGSAKLTMAPVGDTVGAGVDWRVICGGNPVTGIGTGTCGSFSQAHTADGAATVYTAPSTVPIGTSVTITATVTGNPSQNSTLALTIVAESVGITLNVPSGITLQVNQSTSFTATVSNDPSNGGMVWTVACGSPACGSFNPVTTSSNGVTSYTAPSVVPAGGTVTVTATSLTDTTKSASSSITITLPATVTPPPPIAVSISPANIYVQRTGASRSANLTAVVLNDSSNAGVDWSLSCSASNCGSITSHSSSGTSTIFQNSSTLAAGGTITITAKSTADPSKTAVATATVVSTAPASATISSALPKTLNTSTSATLAASSSVSGGVDWVVSCGSPGACGGFNLSPAHTANAGQIVYTAPSSVPSGSSVTITASPVSSAGANAAVTVTTIVAAPPQPITISFNIAPPCQSQTALPCSLTAASSVQVSANVANDTAAAGVKWTATCGSTAPAGCGWFTPSQTASGVTTTYTAPPVTSTGTNVTLIATSVTNPKVALASQPIAIAPDKALSVQFVPSLPGQMKTDTTVNLLAAVRNDTAQGGIDWKVCASGCGFFTIKPMQPAIAATANTPFVPSVPAVTATSVTAWPSGLLIPYTAPSQVPSNSLVGVVAAAHADPSVSNSGSILIQYVNAPLGLSGTVLAGTTPVAGASVALYAAGTTGYGSAATQVSGSVQTDQNGVFTIPAGYSCPETDSQMYLLASGGAVGKFDPNPNLVFMSVLGNCNSLGSGPTVINEVTTVASAFATAPFAANDALNGTSSYRYLGASAGNATGIANAFASVHNLADISTGKVRYRSLSENAAVPFAEINALADILNACAASSGGVEGDSSACGTLFTETDLLGTGTFVSSIGPSDTLQAVFNIAQHPVNGSQYGYTLNRDSNHPLLGLVSASAPFQPILTQQPADWSISLNFSGGGGISSSSSIGSFAIDGSGNLWIADRAAGTVAEWSAMGAPMSPSTGYQAPGGLVVIDSTNNIWVSGDGAITELTNLGSTLPWSPYGGVPGGGSEAQFDKQGNLWIANGNGVAEFSDVGIQLSPIGGFTLPGLTNVTALGIDSANNVWIGAGSGGSASGFLAELSNPGGQLIIDTKATGLQYSPQTAADASGDVWAIRPQSQLCEYKPYGGAGSNLVASCFSFTGGNAGGTPGIDVGNPQGLATDGSGTVWIAGEALNASSTLGVLPLNTSIPDFVNSVPYLSGNTTATPLRVAVDGSGNIWVLLSDNSLTEYVGAATPAVTPLSLAVSTGKLGAKP